MSHITVPLVVVKNLSHCLRPLKGSNGVKWESNSITSLISTKITLMDPFGKYMYFPTCICERFTLSPCSSPLKGRNGVNCRSNPSSA